MNSNKKITAKGNPKVFSDEEMAAMRARAKELREGADGEAAIMAVMTALFGGLVVPVPNFIDVGDVIRVERFTWRYDSQDEQSASFGQFPLRLAWAMTIHKAQGMTVDRTHVLATPGMDVHGSYVALSRHRDGVDRWARCRMPR